MNLDPLNLLIEPLEDTVFFRYQRLINTKKAIYQVLTKSSMHVSLITPFFVNNPNSLGYKAFVFLYVKQNYFNEFTG